MFDHLTCVVCVAILLDIFFNVELNCVECCVTEQDKSLVCCDGFSVCCNECEFESNLSISYVCLYGNTLHLIICSSLRMLL